MHWQGGWEISPWGGGWMIENIEWVVQKPQKVPVPLCLVAGSPPASGCPWISNQMAEAFVTDPLQRKILEATQINSRFKEIAGAECKEEKGRIP